MSPALRQLVRRLWAALLPGAAALALVVSAARPAAGQAGAWELSPYALRVYFAWAPGPGLHAQRCAEMQAGLHEDAERLVGPLWQMTTELAPRTWSATLAALEAVAPPVPEEFAAPGADKRMLVLVRRRGPAWQFVAREYDVYLQQWGTAAVEQTSQPERLRSALFDAVARAFCPLGTVETAEDRTVGIRLRGGDLGQRDPELRFVQRGDALQPYLRHTNRAGELQQIQPIVWTCLAVSETDGSLATCEMFSGLRSPLSGRRRGRVEPIVMLVRPPQRPTTIVLRSRTQSQRPLGGYPVFAYSLDSGPAAYLGQSDRHGRLLVPPVREALRILVVKSGEELLARLPIIPGLTDVAYADVAPDETRLIVEGFIVGLQEELVDTVARRVGLIGRIRKKLEEGDVATARQLLDELRDLPSNEDFLARLRQQEQRALSDDPVVQKKVAKLLQDTQQAVARFLSPQDIELVEADIVRAGGQ